MLEPVALSRSRTYPLLPERAFAIVLPLPLPELFDTRYLLLPPIRAVKDQQGQWGTAGQTRVVLLRGGGSMREELVEVVAADHFSYRLTDIAGPMKALVGSVTGRWSFAAAGTGTRITWSWDVHPASAPARLGLPGLAAMWRPYADRALARLEHFLVD